MKKVNTFKKFLIKESNFHNKEASYYLDDFYCIDGNEYYSEQEALEKIQKVIDYVLSIEYPIKVWRGINGIKEYYDGGSWTTNVRVAEGFGKKIYFGLI